MTRIDHDGAVGIVRVGRADDDGGIGGEEIRHRLPEGERQDGDGYRRAAKRPSGIPPPLRNPDGWRILASGVFDTPDDSWPETGPVGLNPARAGAQSPLKHRPEAPERIGLALTGRTPAQVSGGGPCHTTLEGSVKVGADTAAGPETSQHDCWTAPPTTRILMAG